MKRKAGHLYLRGRVWWMKYYVAGRPVYESTGSEKESLAQRVLNERVGKIARGEPALPSRDRVTDAEAAKDLREHYTSSGDRDVKEAGYKLAHLDRFFQHYRSRPSDPRRRRATR